MVEHGVPFNGIQGTRRRGACRARSGWLHMAIQRGARYAEGTAGDRFAYAGTQLQSGAHQFSSSIWMFGIGLPNSAATFLGTSMISSAFFSFLVRRAMTACYSRFCLTSRLTTTLGPRFLGVRASSSPCLLCRLQVPKCEEYRPSRRNRAPTAPES
jgi:hypothetical protein